MPLRFIRQDIVRVNTDAVVLPANNILQVGPGTSEKLYRAGGKERLEGELRLRYPDGCEMGKAVVTSGYDLPAKWIIHAVCPQWQGGKLGEADFLYSAYRESLLLAKKKKCRSIAFPLLSTGNLNYPLKEAISIAVRAITDFLAENRMEVILVLFTKQAVRNVERLFGPVPSFIDDEYTAELERRYALRDLRLAGGMLPDWYDLAGDYKKAMAKPVDTDPLKDIMEESTESFREMLLRLIEERGMSDPEVYRAAQLTKQNFSKIKNNEHYVPKKKTILALAIALELNTVTTVELLRKVGYTLSDVEGFDRVVRYCLDTRELNIRNINEILEVYDLEDEVFPIRYGNDWEE